MSISVPSVPYIPPPSRPPSPSPPSPPLPTPADIKRDTIYTAITAAISSGTAAAAAVYISDWIDLNQDEARAINVFLTSIVNFIQEIEADPKLSADQKSDINYILYVIQGELSSFKSSPADVQNILIDNAKKKFEIFSKAFPDQANKLKEIKTTLDNILANIQTRRANRVTKSAGVGATAGLAAGLATLWLYQ